MSIEGVALAETQPRPLERPQSRRLEAVPDPNAVAQLEPGVADRSANAPARRMPTSATARDARIRAQHEATLRLRIDRARRKDYSNQQRRPVEPRPFGSENLANVQHALREE